MRRLLAPVILTLISASAAFAHEEGLEYQWTEPLYRQETLLQIHWMIGAVAAVVALKSVVALVRRRRAA